MTGVGTRTGPPPQRRPAQARRGPCPRRASCRHPRCPCLGTTVLGRHCRRRTPNQQPAATLVDPGRRGRSGLSNGWAPQAAAPATASCSCAIPFQGYSGCSRPCLHCLLTVRQNAQPILTCFTVPSDNHKYAATALHKLQAPIRIANLI